MFLVNITCPKAVRFEGCVCRLKLCQTFGFCYKSVFNLVLLIQPHPRHCNPRSAGSSRDWHVQPRGQVLIKGALHSFLLCILLAVHGFSVSLDRSRFTVGSQNRDQD